MLKVRLLCLVLASVASTQAMANSNVMSINHVITNNLPFPECMRRASQTFRVSHLQQFGTTSEAVWGRTVDHSYMAVIYCLTTRDVAVVAVHGPDPGRTQYIVDDLVAAWHRMR